MSVLELSRVQQEAIAHARGPALVLAGPGSGKTTVITHRAVRLAQTLRSPDRLLCVTFTRAAAAEMRARYIKLAEAEHGGGGMCGEVGGGGTDADAGIGAEMNVAGDTNVDAEMNIGTEADGIVTPVFSTVHAYCNGIVGLYERRTGQSYRRIEGEDSPKNELLSRIYRRYNGVTPDEAMLQRLKSYARRESGAAAGSVEVDGGDAAAGEGAGIDGIDTAAKYGTAAPTDTARTPSGSNQIRRYTEIMREYARVKAENHYLDFDDMIVFALRILRTEPAILRTLRARFDFVQVDEAQDLSRSQYEIIRLLTPGDNIFVVADDDQSIYGFRGAEPECLFEFVRDYPDVRRYYLTQNFRSTPEIVQHSAKLVDNNRRRFRKELFTERPAAPGSVKLAEPMNGVGQAELCLREAQLALKQGASLAILYRNGISSLPVKFLLALGGIPYAVAGSSREAWELAAVRTFMARVRDAERQSRPLVPSPYHTFRKLLRAGLAAEAEEQCRLEGRDRKTVSVALDFLEELFGRARSYSHAVKLLDALERADRGDGSAAVMLSTIHSSKGLEFDRVIVIDVLEGELPGTSAAGPTLEDERRLLYVAMTRARRQLILSCPARRGMHREEPSRFIGEIRLSAR